VKTFTWRRKKKEKSAAAKDIHVKTIKSQESSSRKKNQASSVYVHTYLMEKAAT
jgi:hypothetical protein